MIRSSLRNLLSRPYTVRYPYEETHIPANNRGHIVWDMQRCIWCRLCEKNCPTKAITMDKQAKTQSIIRVRCIQCGTCVDVCPTNTISMDPVYSRPGDAKEVHIYHRDAAPFIFEVSIVPSADRDETRLRKRTERERKRNQE